MKVSTSRRMLTSIVTVCLVGLIIGSGGIVTGTTLLDDGSQARALEPMTGTDEVAQTTTDTDSGWENVSFENVSAPRRVRPGGNFTVSATIVNHDTELAVRRVSYRIAGNVLEERIVRIPASDEKTITFDVAGGDTNGFPTGTFTQGVFTKNENATSKLNISDNRATAQTTARNTGQVTDGDWITTPAGTRKMLVAGIKIENRTLDDLVIGIWSGTAIDVSDVLLVHRRGAAGEAIIVYVNLSVVSDDTVRHNTTDET